MGRSVRKNRRKNQQSKRGRPLGYLMRFEFDVSSPQYGVTVIPEDGPEIRLETGTWFVRMEE